jgi:hypothetical protein
VIPLRQHVTALVAVFLALAVGLALGGGLLAQGDDDKDANDDAGAPSPATPSRSAAPDVSHDGDYADAFAAEGAARLYAAGLDGHAVAILSMPGAETSVVKALQGQVLAAGGGVTATFTAGEKLVDADQRELVDTLGSQLTTQLGDPRIDPSAPTYERLGQLLGLALATNQAASVRADLAAVSIRESLGDAGLLTSPAEGRCAPLVLVVLPPGRAGADPADRTILAGLVSGAAHNAAGVVVVGDEASADGGDLAALRESDLTGPVSTVDGVATTIGQVTAVLAMEGIFAGTTGAFGALGSDGVVPLQ